MKYVEGQIRFLLIQHHAGHWGFPKGHREKGEDEEATARRELSEETGVRIQKMFTRHRYVESYTYHRDGKKRKKSVVYFAALVKGQVKIQKEEIRDFAWLSYRSAIQRIPFDEMKRILKQLKKDLKEISPNKPEVQQKGIV